MDRETVLTVALAVLAVLALGVAAATIDTAVTTEQEGGFGGGDGEGAGVGPDSPETVGDDQPGARTQLEPLLDCYPELREPPVIGLLLAIAGTIFGMTYRETESGFASATVAFALMIPVLLVWTLFAFCHEPDSAESFVIGLGNQTSDGGIFPEAGGATGFGRAGELVTTPTGIFTVLVIVAILASIVLLVSAGTDDEPDGTAVVDDDDDDEADVDWVDLGRSAGAAADRIEDDADLDNEVYRAWQEMTGLLDVPRPATSTPAEFAAAAIDAGMDPADVDALTEVFETVRYGGQEPTPDREEQAVEALRNIQHSYGEDD